MKISYRYIFYVLSIFIVIPCIGKGLIKTAITTPNAVIREKVAADIASNLAKKDFAAVRTDFAKTALEGLSEEKIKDTWEGLVAKIGAFQKVVSTKEVQENGYNQIKKRCQFTDENATLQVVFNEENQVIGLFLKL